MAPYVGGLVRCTPLLVAALCGCGVEFAGSEQNGGAGGVNDTGGGGATAGGGTSNVGGATSTGGGGGAAGGGGVMTTCGAGKVDALSDDFDDNAIGASWQIIGDATTVEEVGGKLVVTPHPVVGSDGGVKSVATYDLTECAVSVEIDDQLAQIAGGMEARFGIELDGSNWVLFFTPNDQLQTTARIGGTLFNTNHPYDPVNHRFLRLRETGGLLRYEASPDGSGWMTLETLPTPSFASSAYVTVSAGNGPGDPNPGFATFDNLNP